MKCPSCAANYDDKFSFCPYCGTSQPRPPAVLVQIEEPRYEYCTVLRSVRASGFFTNTSTCVYEAVGTGGNTGTVYARSGTWKERAGSIGPATIREMNERFKEVCQVLEQDGWVPLGVGDKYRRKVGG